MLLADLVATSATVAASSARNAKRDAIADLLRQARPDEIAAAVGFLVGEVRQGRIGVGWATIGNVAVAHASTPTLQVLDVDRALDRLAVLSGPGSQAARAARLGELFGAATDDEATFLRRLFSGGLRQGALEGVMLDAVAKAAEIPAAPVRRAYMLSGDLGTAATVALTEGRAGVDRIGLSVLRGVQPMLASTAASVADALADGEPASVEWKLDGARIQVHRDGDDVAIFTRNLNDVTARLPEVVTITRALPVDNVVLDGEVMGFFGDGPAEDGADADAEETPRAFQDTMSRFGRDTPPPETSASALRPFFFDVLHADGADLIDEPLARRIEALTEIAGRHRIPGIVTTDADEGQRFLDDALAAGHEGVMVKTLDSPYAAGRRGKSWHKVKPVKLLDLVVIGVEWGNGRRQGWLSNLHLGARDPADNSFVMVGKTFKGLTDALLTWQTEQLLARELGREGHIVWVRPDLVVEIALDGVQVSRRYPGGVALRFARVRRYREDKDAADADTIDAVRALLPPR